MLPPSDPSPATLLARVIGKFDGDANYWNPAYAWVGVVPLDGFHVNDDLDMNAYSGGYEASFAVAYERSKNRSVPTDGSAIVELHLSLDGSYYWFDWPEPAIFAQITGSDGAGKYSWEQVVPSESGWVIPGSGVLYGQAGEHGGDNFAREYSGSTSVPVGRIVRLERGLSRGAPQGIVEVLQHGDGVSVPCIQSIYLKDWHAPPAGYLSSWKLTVRGKGGGIGTTAAMSPTIAAGDLKTAIVPIPGVSVNTVTGTGTEADPWLVTFLDFADYPQMVPDPMGLVGHQEWWFAGGWKDGGTTTVVTQACLTSKHAYAAATGDATTSEATALDVVTLTLTVAKLAQFTVYGVAELEESAGAVSGDVFAVSLEIDGAGDAVQARYRARSGSPYAIVNVAQQWRFTLAAGSHTLKLQVQRTSGTGTIGATAQSTLSVHADNVLTVQTSPVTAAVSGTITCVDNPAGCCVPGGSDGSTGSDGGTSLKTYEAISCSESGVTSITIPGVTAEAGTLLIVDFVAGTSLALAMTATFDGGSMSVLTGSGESGTAKPVLVSSFYLVVSTTTTGDVVLNWSSGTIPVAARATVIPNCTNAPYGTSTGYGTVGSPTTGTLGGTNTLPGYVHACFVQSVPSGASDWNPPFTGEAADLDFCTDYRLVTGGEIAKSESETFTASLSNTQTAYAGYECYILGGPTQGGGGSDPAPVACCSSNTPSVLYAKPTGLGGCDLLADGTLIMLTYQSDVHDSFGNVMGAGWYSPVFSCSGGPNVYFRVQCSGTTFTFYMAFSSGTQVVAHSSTPTTVCSPFDYVANFSATLPGGSWSGSVSWSVEYRGVSW